jgi:hypothetical protein
MKRVDIEYGGEHYSVGGRDLEDIKREIDDGLRSGAIFWLEVNVGEGQPRAAHLAISHGVSIALSRADND